MHLPPEQWDAIEQYVTQAGLTPSSARNYRTTLRGCLRAISTFADTRAALQWAECGPSLGTIRVRRAIVKGFLAWYTADGQQPAPLRAAIDEACRGLPSSDAQRLRLVMESYLSAVDDPWDATATARWIEARPALDEDFQRSYALMQRALARAAQHLPALPDLPQRDIPPTLAAAFGVLVRIYGVPTVPALTWGQVRRDLQVWLAEDVGEPYIPRAVYHSPTATTDLALRVCYVTCTTALGRPVKDTDPICLLPNGAKPPNTQLRACRTVPVHQLPTETPVIAPNPAELPHAISARATESFDLDAGGFFEGDPFADD